MCPFSFSYFLPFSFHPSIHPPFLPLQCFLFLLLAAYGKPIPKQATLIFEVEVVHIESQVLFSFVPFFCFSLSPSRPSFSSSFLLISFLPHPASEARKSFGR